MPFMVMSKPVMPMASSWLLMPSSELLMPMPTVLLICKPRKPAIAMPVATVLDTPM